VKAGCRPRRITLALWLALCAAAGCVSQGTYDAEVERARALEDRLRERETRIRQLEATGESLHGERLALLEEIEGLREQAEQIRTQLDRERTQRSQEVRRVSETFHSLVEELESEVASGRLEIERLREGVQLRAGEAILFPSGSADLTEEGRAVLEQVARQLRDLGDHEIRVEGHTDDRPIQSARFPSNWELSVVRSAAVVRALVREGVSPASIAAIGYGAERPIAPNEDADGRARNRRIEIVLVPPAPR
jgi:chemotaxis protein MotB